MQVASQTNDNESDGREQERDRVVWIRTQALAVLLLFIVFWTMATWIVRTNVQKDDNEIPTDLLVDLNLATQAELNLLPGVGEKLANDILNYREEIGEFTSVDELMNIRGIKQGRLLTLRKHITVNRATGQAPR